MLDEWLCVKHIYTTLDIHTHTQVDILYKCSIYLSIYCAAGHPMIWMLHMVVAEHLLSFCTYAHAYKSSLCYVQNIMMYTAHTHIDKDMLSAIAETPTQTSSQMYYVLSMPIYVLNIRYALRTAYYHLTELAHLGAWN